MRIGDNDVFIRRNEAISILEKVEAKGEKSFAELVSSRKPFGLPTNISGKKDKSTGDIEIYVRGGKEYFSRFELSRNADWVDKYKIYITKAYNAGDDYPHQILNKPLFGDKGTCCSETYIVIGPFATEEETKNVMSYIQTKFFRFLVSLRKISQDATQKVYQFVPLQDFSHPCIDENLYVKYGLTSEEIAFIDSMIKPMDSDGGDDDAD
jgi:site-specific DNA-methyltransferase (adenine-specific)